VSLPVLVLALALAPAQPSHPPEGEHPSPAVRPRDEAAKMIEAYLVSNLQESLGLSDEQFVKLLPLVKRLQSERRESMQNHMRLVRELRRSLRSGTATEAQVLEQLKELKAQDAEGPARNRRNQEAVDAVLTPLQQAKFRVLEVDIEQKIRELLGQIRRSRAPGPGAGPGPGRDAPPPEDP
jgi:hypothetical protein